MIDARVQQNMTQKDLSAKTGITQADISRIENGTRNPSLSMVKIETVKCWGQVPMWSK